MPATHDYLAEHPFADPDQVNPPEAPEYVYRPDINSLTGPGSLAELITTTLGAGSRVDIIIDSTLQTYVLQPGPPTGSPLEVVPDDYDSVTNYVYWLLVNSGSTTIPPLDLTFADIGGVISEDQLPPGTVMTVDSIGEDALYFYDEGLALPRLISADEATAFISGHLTFSDIGGTITIDQFPPGSVATLESIDEDAFYFFDDALFTPRLMGVAEATALLGGGGGGNVSNSGTPTAGQLATWTDATHIQGVTNNSTNWDTAYSERAQWDGGSTNLVAATGRTSLGLGTLATQDGTFSGASSGTNTGDQIVPVNTTATTDQFFTAYTSSTGVFTKAQPTFANLASTPTTLSGYGIADAQPLDADLTALAALSGTNTIYYRSAANTWSSVTIGTNLTFSGGTLAATGGGGTTVATDTIWDTKGDLAVGTGADTAAKLVVGANDTMLMADSAQTTGLKWGTPSTVKTALSLVVGTNVQAWDADLDALAALSGTNTIYYRSASNTWTAVTFSGLSFSGGVLTATGGSGTVTVSGAGSLTSNAVVLGAGTQVTKTIAGVFTDGTAKLTLGQAGTSSGSLVYGLAGGGSITMSPTNSASNFTLTVPIVTDTLVGKTTTDIFTNKTLTTPHITSGTNIVFETPGGGTISLAATSTASTRVLSLPNTADDTLVSKNSVDLLTGKTLDSAIVGGSASSALGIKIRNVSNVDTTLVSSANITAYTVTLPGATCTLQAQDGDLDALAALSGTNTIYYRSASNTWTAVTIGTNLTFSGGTLSASGGGGGAVASDTIWDAKGDLAIGTAADTAAKLTVGANDTMLMADSAQTTGLKWGTPTTVKTALGLTIGTNVQAWDADLDTLAGLTATTDNFIVSVSSAWASRTPAQARTTLGVTTNDKITSVGFTSSDVTAVPTGKIKGFFTCAYPGTITAWNIVVDAGTCTIKVWKIATGTAKPTSSNSINTSGVAISTGTAIHSTTLSDFTSTTITANDIFAFNIEAISGVTELTFNLEITKT